jgi:Leucine-rich repeat (LRR) protein
LDISANKITEIPIAITKLASLKVLSLNNNLITTIPPEIGQLKNLTSFTMWFNKNTDVEIPVEISHLPHPLELFLT